MKLVEYFDPRAMTTRLAMTVGGPVTLGALTDRLAGVHGKRTMVTEHRSGRTLTFREAAELVSQWSNSLAEWIRPGDRVVVAVPNGYDQFLASLAVCRAGGLAVPINPQMRSAEVDHVVNDSGAVVVVSSVDALGPTVRRTDQPSDARRRRGRGSSGTRQRRSPAESTATGLAPAHPGDVTALFYTSGTTGRPKGVELTSTALVGPSMLSVWWPAAFRADEVVVGLPVAHIMGFITYLGLALAGISVYSFERFVASDVLDAIEERRASAFIGVPAMYRMMAEAGAEERDLSCVRLWASGADVMPGDLARTFKRLGATASLPIVGGVGEAAFVEGYGMVEVGGGVAAKVSPPNLSLGIGEALGFRLPGWRFRVVDDEGRAVPPARSGELWVKGPGVLKGYWNAPDATADVLTADGWLKTGDLVRRGPLGTIIFQGRKKHVIKSGGYSVYPVEIEAALEEHPAVLEASVVGIPDARLGSVPAAAVRKVAGSKVRASTLMKFAEDRLAHYKAPRRIVFVEDLPRGGTQKVQKERLMELFE